MSDTDYSNSASKKSRMKAPKMIGKYELQKRLGAGGMGAVFLALDQKTKRTVALKVLPRDKAANQTLVKRFQAEAAAAANLEHENIVRVYEADEADGYLYISLEYVDGTDVDQILKKRERMPVKRAAEVIKQVAKALEHAHEQGIVHRDIKPSNIMIRKDNVVKLTDLGLARSIDETEETNITRAGTTVGTVDYMSPEQARNSRLADIRSDLYSLGCTWYQMLVGHPPYHQGSLTNKLQAHASGKIPDPRDENPDVPEATVIMIQQLMAKKPDDRYQTPTELLADLTNASLHRSAISDDVLSALAEADSIAENSDFNSDDSSSSHSAGVDEDDYETEDTDLSSGDDHDRPSRRRRKQKATAGKPGSSHQVKERKLPPRERRNDQTSKTRERDESSDSEKESLLNSDSLKYLLIAGLFIGAFVGIWYVLSSFASGVDPGGTIAVGESQRQTVRNMVGDANSPGNDSGEQTANEGPGATEVMLTGPNRPKPAGLQSQVELTGDANSVSTPLWAREVPVASEISDLLEDWNPKPRTVGRWKNSIGAYPSIHEAIDNLPEGTVWIQLLGSGPFLMNPEQFENRNVIFSSANPEAPASIVCVSAEQSVADFLTVTNGSLLLSGVHLVTNSRQFSKEGPARLLTVENGNLFVRDSSLTLFGTREAPTYACFHASSSGGQAYNVLIDRSVVRGHWRVLTETQPEFEAVISNSLLLTRRVPVIELVPISSEKPVAQLSRLAQIINTTAVTSGGLMSVKPADKLQEPGRLTIELDSSRLISAGTDTGPLLRMVDWPVSSSSSAVNLICKTSKSEFTGWDQLLTTSNNAVEPITDDAGWKKFWKDNFDDSAVVGEKWSVPQPLDIAVLNPAAWLDEQSPGVQTDQLNIPSGEVQETSQSLASLTSRTPPIFAGSNAETIELDLDKVNLDQELQKKNWNSGTRFLLRGTKPDEIAPVVVEGRSFTLEFAPDQPPQFQIQYRGNPKDPLISLSNASLQLKNARFHLTNKKRGDIPEWMLSVKNGSLLIEGSSLTGPYADNKAHRGLIHWEMGEGRSTADDTPFRHLLMIDSSFLRTRGTILSLSGSAGRVEIERSLLAAQGVCLDYQFSTQPETSLVQTECLYSTFAASEAIFHISGSPDDRLSRRGEFFLRDCLAVSLASSEREQTRMTYFSADPQWLDRKHLLWWERATAVSTAIQSFARGPEASASPQNSSQWVRIWGAENVQKTLYSPDGVILVQADKIPTNLWPDFFELDAKSRSLKWSTEGGAVGADLKTFEYLTAAEEKQESPGATKPRPTSGF